MTSNVEVQKRKQKYGFKRTHTTGESEENEDSKTESQKSSSDCLEPAKRFCVVSIQNLKVLFTKQLMLYFEFLKLCSKLLSLDEVKFFIGSADVENQQKKCLRQVLRIAFLFAWTYISNSKISIYYLWKI